jgi:hypothetical protein
MSDPQVPITQPGDPPPEPGIETPELVNATTADGGDVPDTSEGVPQHQHPVEGAPS